MGRAEWATDHRGSARISLVAGRPRSGAAMTVTGKVRKSRRAGDLNGRVGRQGRGDELRTPERRAHLIPVSAREDLRSSDPDRTVASVPVELANVDADTRAPFGAVGSPTWHRGTTEDRSAVGTRLGALLDPQRLNRLDAGGAASRQPVRRQGAADEQGRGASER